MPPPTATAAETRPILRPETLSIDAVHDRDPRLHADARPLRRLSHDQLPVLARTGAQVVAAGGAR